MLCGVGDLFRYLNGGCNVLSLCERQAAYERYYPAVRRKAYGLAGLRLRDVAKLGLDIDDVAQDAIARHWFAVEEQFDERPIASIGAYWRLCIKTRLRFRRRPLGWDAPEVISQHMSAALLAKLIGALPTRCGLYVSYRAAGLSDSAIARALLGNDSASSVAQVRQLGDLSEHLACLVLCM